MRIVLNVGWWRRLPMLCAAVLMCAAVALVPVPPASATPVRPDQWYLDELRIPAAHKVATGSGVTVAVIDTGFDPKTPDLAGHVLCGKDQTVGLPAKCGWEDDDGHGSHMASIIASQGGGADHALGVAPGAKVLPISDAESQPKMATAIRYAVSRHANVINVSLALSGALDPALKSAVEFAVQHDVVVVAAAGNIKDQGAAMDHPADLPGVVAVTGTTKGGASWSGSSYGSHAGIAAPATDIVAGGAPSRTSTGYVSGTGTSDSAAIVSGVVALIRQRYPDLDAANTINRLVKSADDKGPKGRDDKYGYGLVNPVRALTADIPKVSRNPLGGVGPSTTAKTASPHAGHVRQGTASSLPWVLAVGASALVVVTALMVVLSMRRKCQRSESSATVNNSNGVR